MIENSDTDSPFFEIHRKELDVVLAGIENIVYSVNGWCNAFGYNVTIDIKNKIQVIVEKSQLSHQDPFLPRNGTDVYAYSIQSETIIDGTARYGKSFLMCFGFRRHSFQKKIIYTKNIHQAFVLHLFPLLGLEGLSTLELKNQRVTLIGKSKLTDLSLILKLLSDCK